MKPVLVRLAAVAGAALIALATFVIGASLDSGFWTIALLALAAFIGAGYVFLRWSSRASGNSGTAGIWG